ncbi:5-carboxymethyl-2-hydroxymuconate Delta-isomerase [Candidimonas nitroreducens]|uniref:5-carboxymethyl-2-hydroxymuconate isomerase n=1 Tax=Candidimonas nitroreducens TaxID=683354 RepID=A0A225LYZ2_9BURK|nr:5-carboxymethyl-2-hydroxymuconate isomerase [Candidimonas nitroreducens]OWT53732.1 5-carboxymethyl-2-hydroxymuconate isomerase [Candidimonas nitroreducens]
MPHLTLEVSGNLAHVVDPMLAAVTDACQQSGHFDQAVIMSRAVIQDRYCVRQQGMSAFANLCLRIRPGRNDEARAQVAQRLAHAVHRVMLDHGVATPTCITCEIQEIDVRSRALIYAGEG